MSNVVYIGDVGSPRFQAVDGSDPFVDADGVEWFMDQLDGWFFAPGPRSDSSAAGRPGADGEIGGPVFLSGRQVIIGGWLTAPDNITLFRAMDRVGSLLAAGDRFDWLTVAENDGALSRSLWVHNGGAPLVAAPQGLSAAWSLSLKGDDPRKLSAVEHTLTTGVFVPSGGFSFDLAFDLSFGSIGNTGRIFAENVGNAPADLTLTLTGPLSNPRVSHTESGRSLGFTIELSAGETLTVTSADRSVLLNGTASRRSTMTNSSEWFTLATGSNTLVFNAASADSGAQLSVSYRDSWV